MSWFYIVKFLNLIFLNLDMVDDVQCISPSIIE